MEDLGRVVGACCYGYLSTVSGGDGGEAGFVAVACVDAKLDGRSGAGTREVSQQASD